MTRKPSPDTNSPRRAPSEQDPAADAQDADWGFAEGKKERVLEPRLGLALVTCLVLMFGFVLYHKYQSLRNAEGEVLAGGATSGENAGASTTTEVVGSNSSARHMAQKGGTDAGGDGGLFGPPNQSEPTPTLAPAVFATTGSPGNRSTPHSFGGTVSSGSAKEGAGPSAPLQSEPSPFGNPGQQELAESRANNDANADPFFADEPSNHDPSTSGELAQNSAPADRSASPSSSATWDIGGSHSVAVDEPREPDPFAVSPGTDTDLSGSSDWQTGAEEPQTLDSPDSAMPLPAPQSDPESVAQAAAPAEAAAGEWDPNPFAGAAAADEAAHAQDSGPADWPLADTAPYQGSRGLAPAPALQVPSLAAPSTQQVTAAGGNWNLSSLPKQSSPGVGEQIAGERNRTITSHDSLWSISQDVYGTARYVPALARYNQDTVPHPDKLSLGVHIHIPPPEVLEARFPDLFHRSARRDAMVSPAGEATAHPSQTAEAGMFLDAAGNPHYRADKSDTLTRIAQRYLGRASRWTEILAMNHDRLPSPESLKPGMVLRMPADAGRISLHSDPLPSR